MIDVSGDGANNQGPPVTVIRDQVLEQGITINGLPIMLKRAMQSNMDIENLDVYYEDCVIGGPGSFVIPIQEREKFKEATRTKLVLEIAGRQPAGARDPGVGGRAAHLLPDRRAHVAISLGRTGFQLRRRVRLTRFSGQTSPPVQRASNSGTGRPA